MNYVTRSNEDNSLWYVFGDATLLYPWNYIFGGGGFFANQWITVGQIPGSYGSFPTINLTNNSTYTDPRDADRVTFDIEGQHTVNLVDIEYLDGVLDKQTDLILMNHYGFTTDGSIDELRANIGNHDVTYTTAIKDTHLSLGGGWDTATFSDQLDIPDEQYWSFIRRAENQVDAYSLLTGRYVRMDGGAEARTAVLGSKNYGEIEHIYARDDENDADVTFKPGGGTDFPDPGDIGLQSNIDLRSDGATHTDSFNLAYFNFIRYTSDNVWVGESTIHDGTDYSTPSDRRVATDKNVLLKSGYTYDAPVLDGQLSVIGQSRNGTHDLIVAERDPGEAINGHFRLYGNLPIFNGVHP